MDNHIVAIGTSNPGEAIPQAKIGEFMSMAHGLGPVEKRKLQFVYRISGIESRFSVLSDFHFKNPEEFAFFPKNKSLEPFPSTKKRMEVFREMAPGLAQNAIVKCLEESEVEAREVTHLILVSCTGMYAPGVEMEIIAKMGFTNTIERYAIHFMGCYAAFNGIKLADRILKSQTDAKVLVLAVELCTIHFQKVYNEDNLLANALFGDGAAALMMMQSTHGLKIKDYQSQIFSDGDEDMAWNIGDHGFEMKLTKYVPELLDTGIQFLREKLENRFFLDKIKHFAIHPGGTQILKKVEQALGIPWEQNRHAHHVLKSFGNMSSVSILFVFAAILQDPSVSGDVLSMGFGPGLTMETLLIEKKG